MKLKTEIFLFLFLTGLSVIVILGTLYNYNAKRSMLSRLENQLESLSESKKRRVEGILNQKLNDLSQVQNNTLLKQNLFLYSQEKNKDKHLKNSYRLLIYNTINRAIGDIHTLKNIHILDVNGNMITSSDPTPRSIPFIPLEFLKKSIKSKITFFNQLVNDSSYFLGLACPISYKNDTIGIVFAETYADELIQVTSDYTGLGETGETTLAMLLSDSVAVYLNGLRFHPKPYFHSKMNQNQPQAVFQVFKNKKDGMLHEVLDYRNTSVFASARYIPGPGWALIIKIDQQEALKPIKEFQSMSYRIAFFALVILSIISIVFANHIVQPVNKISEAAQRISKGDLALRVNIHRNNELGTLADSFNEMTRSLVEAQGNLQEKLSELDRSNVALEKFAYIVSHDLKAPLNSITSLSEIILTENNDHLNEDGQKMFSMLQVKVKQMHDLINGILEYSKIDHPNVISEEISISEIVNQVIDQLSPPSHVKITQATLLPFIRFERILIFQVFQNLISNAIKYNNKPEVMIRVGHLEEEGFDKFYVEDNGQGIEEKYRTTIFDIFITLQPKGADSTGIGLAIVKKIIENKGGTIYVESKIREGSTFYFTVPK